MSTPLDKLRAAGLQQFSSVGDGKFKACCPAHDDHSPTLSITVQSDKVLLHCFAGCRNEDIVSKLGLEMKDLYNDPPATRTSNKKDWGELVAAYDYRDEQDQLLYQSCRFRLKDGKKDFKQRRPDSAKRDGWNWSVKGKVRYVPYRLRELLAADPSQPVFIVEGEKDVNRLIEAGAVATCNVGGAGKWKDSYSAFFKGRQVVVIADNDEPGLKHAKQVAESVAHTARAVRMIERLPDVPEKGDVFDWLNAGHAVVELVTLGAAFIPPTAPQTDFPLTEVGDAEFFASHFKGRVYFDHLRDRFLISDDASGLWLPDSTEKLTQMVKESVRARQKVANTIDDVDARKAVWKWAIGGESRSRISSTLALVRSERDVADGGKNWDQDPFLLGCPNGVVDLRTGVFRRALSAERVTMRVQVAYDPNAKCPLWEKTLLEIFAKANNPEEMVGFIQRGLGYSITGDCREECCFFTWGDGSNGKGVLINTIGWVLLDYVGDMPFGTLEQAVRGDRNAASGDVARLEGRRFITCAEVNEFTINESRLKALTGRDPISARFLYKDLVTFIPVGKIWIATNNKPKIVGRDEGIWRRIKLIPFNRIFAEDEQNKQLKDQLRAEAAGILNWLIAGALAWQKEGLNTPKEIEQATADYKFEMHPLNGFIAATCVEGEKCSAPALQLFLAYKKYCDDLQVGDAWRLSDKAFYKSLRERFTVKEGRQTTYMGIGLRSTWHDDGHAQAAGREPDAGQGGLYDAGRF